MKFGMKYFATTLFLLALALASFAQAGIDRALRSIEENNPLLKALRAEAESIKTEARSEFTPPNPEVEGGIFPAVGNPGNKYAWGVSQSFEFPTVYAKRVQLAHTTDRYADQNYNVARQSLLLEAKNTLQELIHARRMTAEYQRREAFARAMVAIIQKKVDEGQSSVMDLNNARLRVIELAQNVRESNAQVTVISRRVSTLNGNMPPELNDTILLCNQLPPWDEFVSLAKQTDPRFVTLNSMVEVAQGQKSLAVHRGLPELNIGYQSEKTDVEHFAGVKAGLSIPLWGNVGNRRVANARLAEARYQQAGQANLMESEYEELYQKAQTTKELHDELQNALSAYNNLSLLRKALEAGQVSVIDFFNEVTFLYSITDRVLELELEYAKLFAELHRFEL